MTAFVSLALLISPTLGDDPTPPSIDAIVAGLKQTEASIHDLAVTTDYVRLQKYPLKVDKPVRAVLREESIVTADGKSWYECVGERISSRPDGVTTYRGRWRGSFDGKVARSLEGGPDFEYRLDGAFHSGSIGDHPSWNGVPPLEYTTHYGDEPVSKTLTDRPPIFVGRAEWEGRPVVILDTPTTINGAAYKGRFWVDPARRTVVLRSRLLQLEPGKTPWREYTRTESHDHRETAPGIWLPTRFKQVSTSLGTGGKPDELAWSFEGTNSRWKVNQNPPASTFEINFPVGVTVEDHRRPPKAEPRK